MLDNHHLYPDFMDLRPDNMRYVNDDPEQHRSVNMYGMSMVERYLYSLPEYRMEMHRSNFIEIFSYNGLLATRKVIEFDGDTVLCRVCGDKASGFHYGVHACEGCKGFFRRSIQQKIQYRPCLKNQQCNIMRVNRNRCQYCRLKKCIAVGMSRDAVRFGRVPKKEKAKIMEQMHKVNSQSQVTLLNTVLENSSDITHKIVDAHVRTCDFTQTKLRAFLEKAWQSPQFVNCPAHMACPLNPSPETSDGTKKWDEFSECFTPAIRNVVNFAKCIPGFQILSQEDQVTLLKAGTFEVLLVHLACLFDAQTNTMCFANGKLYKRVSLTVTNSAGFLLDSMFDFAERLNTMQLSDEEIALFSAIVIIAADRPGLRNVEQVERVQNRITQALQALMSSKHPDDPALFAKLLMKIPDLRTLNTLHSEKLLGLTVPAGSGKNGGAVEKPRTSVEGQGSYYPGGMMPGGFPVFGGPMVPGHLRESGIQYPVHPPDVPGILPHQMSLDSTHQNHSIVLQTPLGTFHRYNSALQQHLSMNRPIDYPSRQGECPVSTHRERQDDMKTNDFNAVPKFKTEEAVHSAIQNQVKEQQRAMREELREVHSRSESGTPITHEGLSVASSEGSGPKPETTLQHPGLASWPMIPRKHTHERPSEPQVCTDFPDHPESDRLHKRRSTEDEESVARKAHKFWSDGGRGGCPVTSGYTQRLTSSLQHSMPATGLHSPPLMSIYQKETMLHFHHQQQQQHYDHQKQLHQNHSPTNPRYVSEDRLEEHRNYSKDMGHRRSPESQYERPKLEKEASTFHSDTNTSTNLPELKSALSRPPLSSPDWTSERKSSLSEPETGNENIYRHTNEGQRTTPSLQPSSFDSHFVHKKLKMKRRGSSETVSSDGSVQEQDCRSPVPVSRHYPTLLQTSSSSAKAENSASQESQAHRSLSDKDIRNFRMQEQICRSQDANANEILSVDDQQGSAPQDTMAVQLNHPDVVTSLRTSQFAKESVSKERHLSPTISLLDDEISEKAGSQPSRPRSPMHSMKYNMDDSSVQNKEGNLRQNSRAQYDTNTSKYYNGNIMSSRMEESKTIPKSSSGHPSSSGLPPRLQNGMCGGAPYPPHSGVAPHPAYLPLPFPPMHPALMYQYNMAAAHQMAQLQQLQLAQAQMAIHHQVAMSKSDTPHQGAAPAQGKEDLTQGGGPKPSDIEHNKETPPSDTSRERHPLNLSKSQDTATTNQKPVFVKPEPM